MDPWSAVVDEVALEGLDGITIHSLWIRLEDRQPKFPLKLDDCTKELIWRSLISNTDLKFYELPREREDVELFDRFKDIDPETGIETTPKCFDKKKDVYPVHIILEHKNGIQGSCVFFKERKDITQHLRSKSLTDVNLEESLERYGRRLVVVASQTLRFRTLIGRESDPDLKLNDDSYCLLERVGRARWQGELQSDLHGYSFKTDARKLHYIRKALVKHGLISMQSHVTRMKSGQQQHSILLLLKRFHINRRSKHDMLMEYVSSLLQQLPGQFATLIALREQLNVSDCTFKRVFHNMRAAKLVEICQLPLEDLDPSAGPCTNKKGNKVLVRCLRLLKPYSKKGVTDDDDDDDDEEDYTGAKRRTFPPEGRIMERDVLSQAYHIVLSCGAKGIPQTGIGYKMNIGKLESRMLCRRLERHSLVKGFMEDEGRQRTTKFISHKCVGVSDQLQLFAKEQERQKRLCSSAPQTSDAALDTSKTPSSSKLTAKAGAMEAGETCSVGEMETGDGMLDGNRRKASGKSGARGKMTGKKSSVTTKQTQSDISIAEASAAENETPGPKNSKASMMLDVLRTEKTSTEEVEQSSLTPVSSLPKSPAENNIITVSKGEKPKKSKERPHETYRLLRRKNMIVEAVRNFKIIEGYFPLRKMINDEEKQDGISSKCCKKTIFRLVQSLSREGLLKVYTTTVIQDGITKKVDMIVHPSVQPNDDIVHRVIEQVRFKISSSYSTVRLQQAEEKARQQERESQEVNASSSIGQKIMADKKGTRTKEQFKPTTVRGLGKSFGFQPKMHRLRVVHNFLWYLIYGHPLRTDTTGSARHPNDHEQQNLKDTQTQSSEKATSGSVDPQTTDSAPSTLDTMSGDEGEGQKEESLPDFSQSDIKVYADEESWKRFIPPVRVHKEFSSGWALVGDLLLCLPLSIFIQVIQINYKVDGLEEYLNDPVKQHHLVRVLPPRMRRQLLYKRKYLFSFHENLQKLVYMGLLQFGPVEKFKEKDQVFVYLRHNATIVDTTNAEPHYWLVTELPDKPFERRQYTFNTAEDVENYWFDLMCVCLNTPLGVIRSKRNVTEEDTAPSFVQERNVFVGMAYLLKGSRDVCDDGSIPGDGKGAGGLDSEFFAHLKRNWLWTNHLLAIKTNPSGLESKENKIRLKSLLSKNALRIALTAGGTATPRYVTTKQPLMTETVEVGIESASRNLQVIGGKRQKRRRSKKEVVKVPRKKKKEPEKRTPAHDEADHRALKMMTRQRVFWSVQEDSLMMLCAVASHLLNSNLKRPFVPYCVVRDLLHAEFEVSMDKTSVAVGRRTRYILKNPQTLLNYRICLAEVYQDKPLMSLLEQKKPGDPDKPEDWAEAFSEYTRLLRQKFSAVMNSHNMIMPDTKQQLFSRFKVSTIDDGKLVPDKDVLNCTEDIQTIVLHNLIQSTLAMTNSQMKSSRSFQTFHMYSKYDQEVLCQVFIQCRKRGLVNRRRVSQSFGPKKNRALPILPMSYQLSQSYYRCFSWRFPHMLCTDSFRFLRSLSDSGTRDDRPITVFYHETENRSANGEVLLERQGSKLKEKQKGGNPDNTPMNEQPDETNTESTKEGDEDQLQVKEEKAMEGMNSTDEQNNLEGRLEAGSGYGLSSTEQTDDYHLPNEDLSGIATTLNAAPGVSKDPSDVLDMMQFSLETPGAACVVSLSLMSLGLLSVYMSIPKQMVVVDSNLVDNDVVKSMAALEEEDDDDYDGEDCEGRKKLEVKAHQASHTNYLMMRGYCCPGIVKLRNLNTNDNIVMESCLMKLQLRSTPAHHMFSTENSPPLDFSKCGPSLLPSILTYSVCSSSCSVEECNKCLIEQRGYTPQDIEACTQIRRCLDEAGENGLDMQSLYQILTHQGVSQSGCTRSLEQYLKDLQDECQLLRVGALGIRWVLMQHAEPWLLTVNFKQWSQSRFTSDRLPFLENQHNIPFMRKRCRRGTDTGDELSAKRTVEDRRESRDGQDVEGMSDNITRERLITEENMEMQKEKADEASRNELLNSKEDGGGEQTLHKVEEGGHTGEENMKTEERQEERRELRSRKDITSSSLLISSADVDACEDVSFISRPWRMVDGTLNRQVCKGMLEAVLYHIMSRPGLTQQMLVEHYKGVLQPVAVLDLVQALLEMGCVMKKTVVKGPKPSLFTCPVQQIRDKAVWGADADAVFYEPTISCCLRLSQMLPNERHWNNCIL